MTASLVAVISQAVGPRVWTPIHTALGAALMLGALAASAIAQPVKVEGQGATLDDARVDDPGLREPQPCKLLAQAPYQGRSLWNVNLWSDGVVPYEFDSNTTSGEQTAMRQAMNALEAAAYIHFVVHTGQGDYLHILNDSGNYAEGVGDYGGFQPVHIYNWNYEFIMCHELMHALGLWHEQSRSDRDQYLTVNYGNIQAGWGSQYDIQPGTTPVGPFDFDSVMCYGACDASVCCPAGYTCPCASNCWTMTALPAYAQYQGLLGNRTHLSSGDVSGLVSRYGAATCPVFNQQPTPITQVVGYGQTVSISASATGAGTPTYRWRKGGVNLTDDGRITGSGTATLTISNAAQADTGSYDCVAANSCGNTTSNGATLFVQCLGEWTQVASSGPPGSYYGSMAFDSDRGVAVYYGGADGINLRNETWEWNGIAWAQKPGGQPGLRYTAGMVYDSSRHVAILFGGAVPGATANYDDTWAWNGTTWSQRAITGPAGRQWPSMAYDSVRHKAVLFGGYNGPYLGDTWEWDGVAWAARPGSGPSPRGQAAMAFDSARGVVVLFGGEGGNGSTFYGDTWELGAAGWVLRSVAGPPARTGSGLAYDAARGVCVLFGGYPTSGDTWEWDGNTWTQGPDGPPVRYGHSITFDSWRSAPLVFGGHALSDTWELRSVPSIRQQPTSQTVCGAGSASFHVDAVSESVVTYQWRHNGFNVGGPNSATISFSSPSVGLAGIYDCVVSNQCDSVTSGSARLTINSADFNGDGDIGTDADIEAFFACLSGNCCPACGSADFNGDGDLGTDGDIEAFFRVLAGGSC